MKAHCLTSTDKLGLNDPFAPTPLAPWILPAPLVDQGTLGKNSPLNKPLKKPSRPLTAYNLFFHHERVRLRGPSHDGNGKKMKQRKVAFADMARIISRRWKEADHAQKAPFYVKANQDKLRYLAEKTDYKKELDRRRREQEESESTPAFISDLADELDEETKNLIVKIFG